MACPSGASNFLEDLRGQIPKYSSMSSATARQAMVVRWTTLNPLKAGVLCGSVSFYSWVYE